MELRPYLRIDDELSLHLARPELATPIFEAVDSQRSYLRQWLPWVDATRTADDTKTYIRESMGHNTSGARLITFIMAGERLVGSVSVVKFNRDNKSCEIGYWLHRDFQGRGIMTRACACLIDHLFKTKDLNRIEILVATGNPNSQAVPVRLGFRQEGTLREALLLHGQFKDLALYGLIKKEWALSGPAPE